MGRTCASGLMAKPHHGHTHRRLGTPCVVAANADPTYRCPLCGLTREQGIKAYGNKGGQWDRGHKGDTLGKRATSTADYEAQHAHCNRSRGATLGNKQREPHTERW